MKVEIASSVVEAILAHAASSRDEVCGLLLTPIRHPELVPGSSPPRMMALGTEWAAEQVRGDVVVVGEAMPCTNLHPTPATHFELDPATLLAAHRAARAGGPGIVGHYHSHPTGRAEPSATDAASAPPDGAIWFIVARDEFTTWRAVPRGALHDRFDPVELVVT